MSAQQRLSFLQQAFEFRIITVDQADIYGGYQNEVLFDEARALAPQLRERLQIVVKCGIKLVIPAKLSHQTQHDDTSRAIGQKDTQNALGRCFLNFLLHVNKRVR